MIAWVCFWIIALIFAQYLIAIIRVEFFWKNHRQKLNPNLPFISILVAARNEEKQLPELLASFEKLDYPADRLQFLFADDQSSDRTSEILKNWCALAPNRETHSSLPSQTSLYNDNGKANALAFLEEKATGDYYFFTDADCAVNPSWIKEGVSCFEGNIGIVIGITQVKAVTWMEKFQEIDWWLTLGFVKVATDLTIETTGLGNNMVISKEAYQKSGGFKNLPYCLTEDLEISRAIQREGFRIAHQVSPQMLAMTNPEASFQDLLSQRKRWMNGVMTLPLYWKLMLSLQFFYFVGILVLLVSEPVVGLSLVLVKIGLQGIFLTSFSNKSSVKISWTYLLVFDFYNFNTTALTILYYFWPSKTKWKSRIYPCII